MTSTYTSTEAVTFTITNAEYIASKVKTDLMRLCRYYNTPTLEEIEKYHTEMILLQMFNFLDEIMYGFSLDETWVKALKYTARQGGVVTADEDPGGIHYSPLPPQAKFSSLLRYNDHWRRESQLNNKRIFLQKTPIIREPGNNYSGNWVQQRAYSSGGRGILRSGI